MSAKKCKVTRKVSRLYSAPISIPYEYAYRALFMNAHLFNVENPERFLEIIHNGNTPLNKEPLVVYAKKHFNEVMNTNFDSYEIEIEVMHMLHFLIAYPYYYITEPYYY